MSQTYVYPFDPTGSLTSNVIPNERHVLSGVTDREFNFIVPKFAPFFRNNLRIRHLGLGRDLVEGVDYHLTHWFHAASHGVGRPVYGSITFIDRSLTGVVELRYQTIGGDWVYDEGTVLELMANRLMNPRITTWEQVVDLPFQFPVIDHEWDLDDLTGAKEVVEKLEGITAAINAANDANGTSHVGDTNNPHRVTKLQVGLGLVENYPMANIAEATVGLSNELYMTPVRVRNFVENYVNPLFETHTLRNDNPHGVTKTQVGLGNVQNYGVATAEQTVAGTSNTLYVTPVAVKATLDANVFPVITAHTNRKDNPHGVTKAQVGLNLVENLPLANQAEAIAGSRNDRYMTPLTTYQMVSQYVGEGMNNHISNLDNPHRVTKGQVGLGNVLNYGIATDTEMVVGTADNLYTTPKGVRAAIEEIALSTYRDHTNDGNNPHGTTKAHVGLGNVDNYPTATRAEAVAGTATNRFMTPATTQAMLENIVGDSVGSHVSRQDNPHQVTKAQVGLGSVDNFATASQVEAMEGTSETLFMTPYTTLLVSQGAARALVKEHSDRKDNPHGVTAAQLGAVTTEDLATRLLGYMTNGSKAVDSAKLNGYTYEQIMASVSGGQADDTLRFGGYNVEELRDLYAPYYAPLATKLEGKSLSEVAEYAGSFALAAPVLQKAPYNSPDASVGGWTKLFETTQTQFSFLLSITGVENDRRVESSFVSFYDTEMDTDNDKLLQRFFVAGRYHPHEVYVKRLGGVYSVWVKHNSVKVGHISCVISGVDRVDDIVVVTESYDEEPVWEDFDPMYEVLLDSCSESVDTLMTLSSVEQLIQLRLDELAAEMRAEAQASIAD